MNLWLLKSEPSCFSIDDLKNSNNHISPWDGVRNYQARNFMKEMKLHDLCFFYHSNANPPGIAGIAEVVKEAYPDYTQFDKNNEHYDPKSKQENPRWYMVDVKFKQKFSTFLSLEKLKQYPQLQDMRLLQKGNRLSVLPISKSHWDFINKIINSTHN